MSVIGSNILAGASGQGGDYTIARSLRFRSSASAYLNRTFGSGNRKTWTWSSWIKRGALSGGALLNSYSAQNDAGFMQFGIENSSTLELRIWSAPLVTTTAVFRDPSAWYHIVLAFDTTQATSSNRVKIYINGVQQTLTGTYPTLNTDYAINQAATHLMCARTYGPTDSFLDCYLAETNFIGGQALTPSSFGEFSTKTGVWQPIKYAGTYGTNGFYLPFTDNASTTTLGNDFSGNGNNWTTNNISLTAGSTYDSMTDVPTLTSATASNFCTLNPLAAQYISSTNFNAANLQVTGANGVTNTYGRGTMSMSSGKYYAEFSFSYVSSSAAVGIVPENDTGASGGNIWNQPTNISYISTGNKRVLGTNSSYGASFTAGDIIGIAVDISTNTVTFYKNGTSQGAITSSSFFAQGACLFAAATDDVSSPTIYANFGQRPFAYTPPTGFVALNTFNLPTPTIGATASTQASDYFNIALYDGNSTARTISGLGFQPDFNWTKPRNATGSHVLTDSVRGVTNFLETNSTGAEQTGSTGIQSWNSDGYALGTGNDWNATGETFVSWNWRASNTTPVTNTAGSITSTVSANTSAGFSVVTYTGNGTTGATVGHGLGVAPSMIIVKYRNSSDYQWYAYQVTQGATKFFEGLSTDAAVKTGSSIWNNTSPTSSVFSLGNWGGVNETGGNYVAYCWSEIAGYSKFGSYTGNGSSDGTMVVTGFRPKYVMIKNASAGGNDWKVFDTARNTANPETLVLYPNLSNAEDTNTGIDFTANGFKLRDNGSSLNGNGNTMIYACFAETPFKYALAR